MKDKVISVIKRMFQVKEMPSEVTQKTIDAWDSLGHLQLIMELEKEFSVKFTMQEIPTLTTLERICQCISEKTPE
jgi:acyl carrier protein